MFDNEKIKKADMEITITHSQFADVVAEVRVEIAAKKGFLRALKTTFLGVKIARKLFKE